MVSLLTAIKCQLRTPMVSLLTAIKCQLRTPMVSLLTAIKCQLRTPMVSLLTAIKCQLRTPMVSLLTAIKCQLRTPMVSPLTTMKCQLFPRPSDEVKKKKRQLKVVIRICKSSLTDITCACTRCSFFAMTFTDWHAAPSSSNRSEWPEWSFGA